MNVDGLVLMGWEPDPEDHGGPACVDCDQPERADYWGEIVRDLDGEPVHTGCLSARSVR